MSRAAATAAGRRAHAPTHARRVSGPSRPNVRGTAIPAPPRAVPRGRQIPAANPVAGAIGRVIALGSQSLSSRWMDRMVRGQAWVVVIGIALIGIVATQVSLLQLNTGIGRAVETKASLERTNAALRVQNSRLGTAERVQRVAGERGLYMPSPGNIRYLSARPGGGDASRAARSMRTPDPKSAATAAAPAVAEAPVAGAEPPVPAGAEPVVPAPGEVPVPVPTLEPTPAPVEPQPTPAPVQEPAAAPTATSTGAVAAP